jgi:hypothetical protein
MNMHNKIVRTDGNIYRIIQATLGRKVLTSVECYSGPETGQEILNLNAARSRRAKIIKNAIKLGLVS